MCRKESRGFTLIEVIVAVAILAMGVIAVAEVFSISLRSLRATRQNLDISTIALSEMRGVLMSPSLEAGSDKWVGEGYTVETLIEEAETEKTESLPFKLYTITLTVKTEDKTTVLKTERLIKAVFKQ